MERVVKSIEETHEIAKKVVDAIPKYKSEAFVIALYGELGSGKTTFIQGAAQALGVNESVISPTFVIERVYTLRGTNAEQSAELTRKFAHFIHIDCYRLESGEELKKLGWDDIVKNPKNIIFIEWAEKVEEILPEDAMKISFEHIGESERKVTVKNSPNS